MYSINNKLKDVFLHQRVRHHNRKKQTIVDSVSMAKDVKIGSKRIGDDYPCYIIAEAGSNHNQELDNALNLIKIATRAKADAIKFQIFKAEKIASTREQEIPLDDKVETKIMADFYRPYELPVEWLDDLRDLADKCGITLLATPFDKDAVDLMDRKDFPAFKIASFEIVDLPLIKHAAMKGKPMIISTGMASLGDIEDAINACHDANNDDIVLMHCGIDYPLKFENVNLRNFLTLKTAFNRPTGYSDHTSGLSVPIASAALGANILEKHFTFDKKAKGPDHAFALDPSELETMVSEMRNIEQALGSYEKKLQDVEKVHYIRGRRSLYAAADIDEGEIITEDLLVCLRPGVGIQPKLMNTIVGRKAKQFIPKHTAITWKMI